MTMTVTLSNGISDRVRRIAARREQTIDLVVEELLAQALPFSESGESIVNLAEPDDIIAREIAAFHVLHRQLWATYPGEYVAIHEGQLIDHDLDRVALGERIDDKFPDQFVLLRRVEQAPERTLYFRSPKLSHKLKG